MTHLKNTGHDKVIVSQISKIQLYIFILILIRPHVVEKM